MTIPNLPTDNLHKFKALSGIAIIMTSILAFGNSCLDLYSNICQNRVEIALFESDQRLLNEKIAELDKQLTDLSERLDQYPLVETDSITKKNYLEGLETIKNDKAYRDFLEFFFKYEEKLFPAIKTRTEIRKTIDTLNRSILIQSRKAAEIEISLKILTEKKYLLFATASFFVIGSILGISLASSGFKKWERIQLMEEQKMELSLENLKSEHKELVSHQKQVKRRIYRGV